MSSISVFYGEFCRAESVVRELFDRNDYHLVTDENILETAAELSGIEPSRLKNAFSDSTSVFNKFTHERERALAFIRLVLAEALTEKNVIVSGYLAHLVPHAITHILRVCLISSRSSRVAVACEERGLLEKDAEQTIAALDHQSASWVQSQRSINDPWSPQLYDMLIPMDSANIHEVATHIEEHVRLPELEVSKSSRQAVQDFILASLVSVALAKEGHDVQVRAHNSKVTLTINKHVLMLKRLKEELKTITTTVPGVGDIEILIGKDYHQSDIYRQYQFEVPSRVLLVDDEKQFIHTLSERLQLRNMGTAVAYDGTTALDLIDRDEPEVMVLDLMMPGIDGIEVLRQVKQKCPDIEVIILSGHGSDDDRQICMDLGAFAYMNKPVEIEVLSNKLKEANQHIMQRRERV